MSSLWIAAGGLVVLAVAWLLTHAALVRRHGSRPAADELHFTTVPGWRIALHRYLPRGDAPPRPTPVILAHGILMNRVCFDLCEGGSLARYLAHRGHDVWVIEYRGAGASRALPDADDPWGYTFDDLATEDVPALIEAVRAATGAARVSWVGHSMGGLVAYAYAGLFGDDALARLVTLGSPAAMPAGMPMPPGADLALRRPTVPMNHLARRFAVFPWLAGGFMGPAAGAGYTAANRATIALCGCSRMSSRALGQLRSWAQNRRTFTRSDGTPYEAHYDRVTVPFLCVAGSEDPLSPPAQTRVALDGSRSREPRFACFADEAAPAGTPALGHLDLIGGVVAARTVFPLVAEFLEAT